MKVTDDSATVKMIINLNLLFIKWNADLGLDLWPRSSDLYAMKFHRKLFETGSLGWIDSNPYINVECFVFVEPQYLKVTIEKNGNFFKNISKTFSSIVYNK